MYGSTCHLIQKYFKKKCQFENLIICSCFKHYLYIFCSIAKRKRGGLTLMNKAISWKVGGFAFLWKYIIFLKGSINFLVNSSQFSDIMYLRISLFRNFLHNAKYNTQFEKKIWSFDHNFVCRIPLKFFCGSTKTQLYNF